MRDPVNFTAVFMSVAAVLPFTPPSSFIDRIVDLANKHSDATLLLRDDGVLLVSTPDDADPQWWSARGRFTAFTLIGPDGIASAQWAQAVPALTTACHRYGVVGLT